MIEAFTVTIREGIEAALVVGIVIAYLWKTGRVDLRKWAYAGLVIAILGSIATAVIAAPRLLHEEHMAAFEGGFMLVAALLVGSMAVWMLRTGKRMKSEIESSMGKFVKPAAPGTNLYAGLGLMAFVFLMVYREGVETVIFVLAQAMRPDAVVSSLVSGAVVGALAAAVFGLLFVRGSLRINLGFFFKITSVALLILVVQLTAVGLLELMDGGVIAKVAWLDALLEPFETYEQWIIVAVTGMLASVIVLPVGQWLWFRRKVEQHRADDALMALWAMKEADLGVPTEPVDELLEIAGPDALHFLVLAGDAFQRGPQYAMTPKGLSKARGLIRRHRLAERVAADVFKITDDAEIHVYAERIQEDMAREGEERLCTSLGHPLTCPHGSPIPEGRCCPAGAPRFAQPITAG